MEKLVLIDGNSLLNRAFYATPVFTTKDGRPTNAIFGFTKLLLKILKDNKPEYLVVAFDMKAPTFRHKMYDEYKAGRKSMPDELAAQLKPLKDLLSAMNVAMCGIEGIEADDILGTLSAKFNVHSYVYTGDRDSYQLVDEKTDVFFTRRGVSDLMRLNCDNFAEINDGLNPSQIIDLKALMGDKSDNIPGIPGIGEKTAKGLLTNFITLDGIYNHIDELKASVREKFEKNKELAYLSYELAKINRNCDIDIKLENCVAPKKFNGSVKKMFADFEFRSLLELNIFDGQAPDEKLNTEFPETVKCKTYAEFSKIIKNNKVFSIDLTEKETKIYTGGVQYSITVEQNLLSAESLGYFDFLQVLKDIYSDADNKVIAFDYKQQLHILQDYGVEAECEYDDLSLLVYLCDGAGLEFKDFLNLNLFDEAYSAFAVAKLFEKYINLLGEEAPLYNDVEKPLVKVLYYMERQGVKISLQELETLSETYQRKIEEYKNKIYEASGKSFNLNSPAKLGEILYNKFGITEVKKKKEEKYVTNADILEGLADKYPVVGDVLQYRLYQKLKSTYLDGFKPLIDNGNRLHTTYKQAVTATGRLSSINPNLQNIPIRKNEGLEIRKIFVPDEGNIFIDADYSQIELRLLAHFSGCKELVEAYKHSVDIHSKTAAQVFGVEIENVTPQMRRMAKAVNFGIIYGISEFGLSKNLGVPLAEARGFIAKYFETYSDVKKYMDENVAFAKKHGYVKTLLGRKRQIAEINSSNYNIRQFGERAAMNMPLQGTSADIIKIAMINVYNALIKNGLKAKLILQVHDELVVEAPKDEKDAVAKILKEEMENAVNLTVPLTVEISSGKTWYDAK